MLDAKYASHALKAMYKFKINLAFSDYNLPTLCTLPVNSTHIAHGNLARVHALHLCPTSVHASRDIQRSPHGQ